MLAISPGYKSSAMMNLYLRHPYFSRPQDQCSQLICSKGSKSFAMSNLLFHHPSSYALMGTPRAVNQFICGKGSKHCAKVNLSSSALMKTRGGLNMDSESGLPEVMDHHPCFSALAETPGALTIYSKSGSTDAMASSLAVASPIGSTKVRDWRSMTEGEFKREVADILEKSCDDISSLLPDNEWDDFCWRRGMLIQKSFEKLAKLYKDVDLIESLHLMRRNYNTSSKVKEDSRPVDAIKRM